MKLSTTALDALLLSGLVLSGCDLAPVYERPHFVLPETYQGSGLFHVAEPVSYTHLCAAPYSTQARVRVCRAVDS